MPVAVSWYRWIDRGRSQRRALTSKCFVFTVRMEHPRNALCQRRTNKTSQHWMPGDQRRGCGRPCDGFQTNKLWTPAGCVARGYVLFDEHSGSRDVSITKVVRDAGSTSGTDSFTSRMVQNSNETFQYDATHEVDDTRALRVVHAECFE